MLLARPVVIQVPHFASLQNGEREIVILRCDDGETWYEHRNNPEDSFILDDIPPYDSPGWITVFSLTLEKVRRIL